MQSQKIFLSLGVATLGAFSVATAAEAVTFTPTSFPTLGFENVAQFEGRYGDNSTGAGPSEVLINGQGEIDANGNYINPTYTPTQRQTVWNNNSQLRIDYIYDPIAQTSQIVYRVNGFGIPSSTFTVNSGIGGSFDSILIGVEAMDDAFVSISNIRIDDVGGFDNWVGGANNSIDSNDPLDYLLLSGFNSTTSFSLRANLNFNIGTPDPADGANRLRFTVNVGRVIPTPALLPGLFGFAAAAIRKRKAEQQDLA